MATSKCGKCESESFEMKDAKISNTKRGYAFVQCSQCGTVIGALEGYNVNYKLDLLKNEMNEDGFSVVLRNQQILNREIQEIKDLVRHLASKG